MLFEGGRFRCRPPFLFLHTKRPARFAKSQLSCRSFVQLRQQESNLRWGSQSPLPYRLAMAHHAKQYSIFSAVPQEVRRIFAAFSVRCLPHLRRFGSVFGLCGRGPAFSISFRTLYTPQILWRQAHFKPFLLSIFVVYENLFAGLYFIVWEFGHTWQIVNCGGCTALN